MARLLDIAVASACAALASAAISHADIGETAAEFFAKDRERMAGGPFGSLPRAQAFKGKRGDKAAVAALIEREAGRQGVPAKLALRVAQVESGLRCDAVGPKTRHGRHYGPFQTRPDVARRFGYTGGAEGLRSCGDGLRYGLAHLADCYRRARGNERLAARCHVGGPGALASRLNPKAERYARQYVAMVDAAPTASWAGRLRVAWN
jgi:soluble lytic murein transglycosylase-like protein